MDQSQEILLGHAIFASSEYGYHSYCRIARSISNKNYEVTQIIVDEFECKHKRFLFVAKL